MDMKRNNIMNMDTNHVLLILDSSGFPAVLLDTDFKVNKGNKASEAFFGKSPAQGCGFLTFCEESGLDCAFFENIESVLSKKTLKYYASTLSNADRVRNCHIAIFNCYDGAGKHDGYVFVMKPESLVPKVEREEAREEEAAEKGIISESQAEEEVSAKVSVLLVEDEGITQRTIRSFLDQLDCVVDAVSTARQAWDALKKAYDIILLDIGLPDKDGIALARDIRQKKMLEMPIVALTSQAWDENIYYEVGIDTVVKKPISKDKLQGILTDYVKSSTFFRD